MIVRIIIAAFVTIAALANAHAEERIERFFSEVDIQRNGDLLVTETIEIRAEGRQIKRGILRDFPTTYRRRDGARIQVGFDVLSVLRDGSPEDFSTQRMANGVRIRIGRSDRNVSRGLHRYVIRYRTTRQIGFFDKFDELYWNATGTAWTFPIDMAEARIKLPEPVPIVQSAIYTGPQGARGRDATVIEQRPGWIVFRTTRPLPVANGLTVAAGWQKGVVAEPTQQQQLEAMLQDNPALIYATVGGAFVIAFYLLAWYLVGRDPPRGTIIPLFGPPEGMSAAAVRFVSEMGFDDRVFAAAIVELGVNGHLRLIDRGGNKELQRLAGGRPLDAAERAVATELFATKSTVKLDNSEHKVIGAARTALSRVAEGDLRRQAVHQQYAVVRFRPGGDDRRDCADRLVVPDELRRHRPVHPGGHANSRFCRSCSVTAFMRAGRREGGRRGMLRFAIGLLVVVTDVIVGLALLAFNIGFGLAMLPAILPSALAVFAALGFSWLQAPTKTGRNVMDQIEGFKQYLDVAEEDRLEFLNPPEKTPELFERFLPYAIALNVENRWAQRFAGVLAAAGVGAAVSSWYTGDSTQAAISGPLPIGWAAICRRRLPLRPPRPARRVAAAPAVPRAAARPAAVAVAAADRAGGGDR